MKTNDRNTRLVKNLTVVIVPIVAYSFLNSALQPITGTIYSAFVAAPVMVGLLFALRALLKV